LAAVLAGPATAHDAPSPEGGDMHCPMMKETGARAEDMGAMMKEMDLMVADMQAMQDRMAAMRRRMHAMHDGKDKTPPEDQHREHD